MCRFHLHRRPGDYWFIRCTSEEAYPPTPTHKATADRFIDGEFVRRLECCATSMDAAVWGVIEQMNRYQTQRHA